MRASVLLLCLFLVGCGAPALANPRATLTPEPPTVTPQYGDVSSEPTPGAYPAPGKVGTVPQITVYVSSQGVQATVSGATSIEADAIYTAEQTASGVVVLSFTRAPTWILARAADGRETRWSIERPLPAPTPLPAPYTFVRWLPLISR